MAGRGGFRDQAGSMPNVAAIGLRTHSGWAAAVCLTAVEGRPVVLDRRRINLLAPGMYFEPYHAAKPMPRGQAEDFIERALAAATELALLELGTLRKQALASGHEVHGIGLVRANSPPPPTISAAFAWHASQHAAEGELYRSAVVRASEAMGLAVTGVAGRELQEIASAILGLSADEVRSHLEALRKPLGAPWGRDQKEAALVAWLALRRSPPPV